LAEFASAHREKFGFIRGIFTASETLTAPERAGIERTFGQKLWDWYGMTEPAVVITERANHDGMEVNWEYGYPEFTEGKDLAGDERYLLATSLHNPVMPLIRYETQDVVRVADRLDEARLYPHIRSVVGRKDDCLTTPDGARLPSLNFYSLLQTFTDILRFQFVQNGPRQVVMKVSVRPATREVARLLATLEIEVRKRIGPDMELNIELTDQFFTSPDGKTPTFQRLDKPPASIPATPSAVGPGLDSR
jgi:phenylacetate-coenzyme A ligase PaaK-like adenylate-forming protein